jgi:hypothetical protein
MFNSGLQSTRRARNKFDIPVRGELGLNIQILNYRYEASWAFFEFRLVAIPVFLDHPDFLGPSQIILKL